MSTLILWQRLTARCCRTRSSRPWLIGDEHTADVGDLLYRVGDQRYPFIAIIEGEVAIVDAGGQEIIRHGPSRFLGELNLLSGQTVFVTAVVTQPCATSPSTAT